MTPPRLDAAWLAAERQRRRADPVAARGGAALPGYRPQAHGVGIVHLGAGAFHKAHQAVYTDDVLARDGGDWRIRGISLRGEAAAQALNPQDGLYTVLVRGEREPSVRVVGSIAEVIAAVRDPQAARQALLDPAVKVVTLTVTEKAYGIDRASGRLMREHPAVARDLRAPDEPVGVLGMLVWALGRRRALGAAPFTVLCCDNLPDNGHLLRAGVLDMAAAVAPELVPWIAEQVAFPCSMVDRITPASTDATLDDVARLAGCEDRAAVETEPFSMWVIEDRFPEGRPAWEHAGALMVDDVAPFERMKLRMLNGAHSLLAYAGHVAGWTYVREAIADPDLSRVLRRLMDGAAASLEREPAGLALRDYADALCRRFANPAMAHETYQIAMDGTEKIPQRLLAPADRTLLLQGDVRPFAFAIAAWMRYCLGVTDAGASYALRDPRESEILAVVQAGGRDAAALSQGLMGLEGLFPVGLRESAVWRGLVAAYLGRMLDRGMRAACRELAGPA
ncbi:mannitol dehydrogenase family protein [uncultured Castellaniella sp.]|mgnify:CR=1 FL=1|uniref:mannitol dehydrogenase family protein n=1 Tax=uncultured Castellaniella sp. TaxID=647907 RepID=UPI00261BE2F5|nr:mannitol dehydrogenase family protein [uncultured Castellaniella sp.]